MNEKENMCQVHINTISIHVGFVEFLKNFYTVLKSFNLLKSHVV